MCFVRYPLYKFHKILEHFTIHYPLFLDFSNISWAQIMPRFHCIPLAQPHGRVLKLQWKRGIIVHSTNIQKIDKKSKINKETSQKIVGFVQRIPTKHIPTFGIVRIMIFIIVFWRRKCSWS